MANNTIPPNRKPHNDLSTEFVRALLDYDQDTGIFRWKVRRGSHVHPGDIAGTLQRNGHRTITIKSRIYRSGRLAWLIMTGAWPMNEIDHINCIANDDRWQNLREASRVENGQNRRIDKRNKSGFKGVHWQKGTHKWVSQIRANGRVHFLGSFDTPEQASDAYNQAAHRLHGEFARTE